MQYNLARSSPKHLFCYRRSEEIDDEILPVRLGLIGRAGAACQLVPAISEQPADNPISRSTGLAADHNQPSRLIRTGGLYVRRSFQRSYCILILAAIS